MPARLFVVVTAEDPDRHRQDHGERSEDEDEGENFHDHASMVPDHAVT